jgi:hypothetical protein
LLPLSLKLPSEGGNTLPLLSKACPESGHG